MNFSSVDDMLGPDKNKAIMIILSAPSGGGKTSISQKLLELDPELSLSISVTTRSPRSEESDGVHYIFKQRSDFEGMLQKGQFLEHAEIYGNLYGTSMQAVENKLSKGLDVLFDIDYQGARQIMDKNPDQVVSIFIKPSDINVLKERLRFRDQDDEDVINERFRLAKAEIKDAVNYKYTVINDDFDQAVLEIQNIIESERRKRGR